MGTHQLPQCNYWCHYQTASTVDKPSETEEQTALGSTVERELKSSASYRIMFLKWRENCRRNVGCTPRSLTSLSIYSGAKRVLVI